MICRLVWFFWLAAVARAEDSDLAGLRQAFERPPADARIMMRWWWFGPGVTKAQLEREMRLMKEGGIGGFEVQPVYPLALDDPDAGFRNLPYLSDEFLDALRFTARKASELGLRLDLTLGSGWPYGGPGVPITEAAGRLRVEKVAVAPGSRRIPAPAMEAGEELIAAFEASTGRELSGVRDGVLWLAGEAKHPGEVMFFIASRTGMMVKRPAVGAEGYVLDHYDRRAIQNYLRSTGDRLLEAFDGSAPHAIFCDSLEVFGADWTGDFLEEFRERRGYDLKPHLPVLATGAGPDAAGLRYDWGRTLTELLEERFLAPMRDWARAKGTLFRIQGYGIPPAALSSNAYADLPEGEGSEWKVVRASRWASSASHLYQRQVTSSETWTWLHSPSFRATPLDLKAEADVHFLQGINQIIGHGWPYTPEGAPYPGWRFYAAGAFNDKNPWWIVMPDLALYLQRLSFLLRQGKPANDVALYLPNSDAYASFSPGRVHLIEALRERVGQKVMPQILEAGYGLDFFDDGALERVGSVESGGLVLGGNRYRIVVLPNVELIPLKTLRKLETFVGGGGILVATRSIPATAPGFKTPEPEKAEVRTIAARLFEGASPPARFVRDEDGLGAVLRSALRPDMALAAAAPDVGFIHRTTGFAEIYFVANTGNAPVRGEAAFRVAGMEPEWWDPVTGSAWAAEVLKRERSATTVALHLAPYESRVLVFGRREADGRSPRRPQGGNSSEPLEVDISGRWKVTFGDTGRSETMEGLRSWTDEESTRYYSGTATYEKEVEVPAGWRREGRRIQLDFGEAKPIPPARMRDGMRAWVEAPVREAAVVYVNDKRAGSLWSPPYRLDITSFVEDGINRIRVVVANLALNHMAGRALPNYRLLNLRHGVRFQDQDMDKVQPIPAGLFGPIRLMAIIEGMRN